MNEEIKEEIKSLVDSFNELDYYQTFCRLKEEAKNDPSIDALQRRIKEDKAKIKSLKDDNVALRAHLKATKALEDELSSFPLLVNLSVYRERLEKLVEPLLSLFK